MQKEFPNAFIAKMNVLGGADLKNVKEVFLKESSKLYITFTCLKNGTMTVIIDELNTTNHDDSIIINHY